MTHKKKKQHYVPRFYLKNFGEPIYCLDKITGRVYPRNFKDLGQENFFYEIEDVPEGMMEDFLSEWDGHFSTAYNLLLKEKDLDKLNELEQNHFFLFLGTQFLRTAEKRYDVKNMTDQVYDRLFGERGMKIIPKELKVGYTDDSIRKFQAKMILEDAPYFASIFKNKIWIVMENVSDLPLKTSDNPVAMHNAHGIPPFMGVGIASPGTEIHFPLTPNLILISYDPLTDRLTTLKTKHDHVRRHNCIQLFNSARFMYSCVNDFEEEIQYLEKHPDFKDPKRTRTSVH